jgi:recombination protein RecA
MAIPKGKAAKTACPEPFGTEPLGTDDIKELLDGMRKDLGGDGVMLADGTDLDVAIRGVISTQCAGLDHAIGRGGYPLGRLTILHGPEGCGKTTAALHAVAEVQRVGGIAVYLDKEYKLDLDYGEKLGVDRARLFLHQPSTLEEAFKYMEVTIEHARKLRKRLGRRVPVMIILDSMNAAITKAQFEGDWGDQHMAPQARCFSQNLPKLMPKVYKDDVALVWISQVRQKMNVSFGNDEEIAGGKAPRFYASLIIHLKRIGGIKKGDEFIGNRTLALVQKNQIAPPFKKVEFVIKYGYGIDNERSILELALAHDIVEKSGAWYSVGDDRIGQGMDKAAQYLREHPDICVSLWEKLKGLM